jgi:beta-lactamase regulating signal transducer with metallopeptidase domain
MAYLYRLLCLCLASFFLLHLLSGLVMRLLQGPILRASERMPARSAARLLFFVRLLPAAVAISIVAVLCIPSYLLLEPHAWSEPVGPWCFAVSCMGAVICSLSAYRATWGLFKSADFERSRRPNALQLHFPDGSEALWVTESASPGVALAGIFRPTLLISRQALNALPTDELQAAIRHERAHLRSRDNLKRLVFLLAPDILPFWSALSGYKHAWARFTEWAADDDVTNAGPEQTLSLASALVRVARLETPPVADPLMTSFLADACCVSARVERLLSTTYPAPPRPVRRTNIAVSSIAASVALLAVFAVQSQGLRFVHEALEHLIR